MKVKSVPWKLKDMTPYRKHISKLKQCDKDIVFITFGCIQINSILFRRNICLIVNYGN